MESASLIEADFADLHRVNNCYDSAGLEMKSEGELNEADSEWLPPAANVPVVRTINRRSVK